MSKTLILSDIHFGMSKSTATSAEQFRHLWKDCSALILNGDTVEEHAKRCSEVSQQRTADLLHLAKQDGVKTTLLCGNHDPIVSETECLWFCDKKVLVFHGHAPIPKIAPWSWRGKHAELSRYEYLLDKKDGFEEQLASLRQACYKTASGAFQQYRPTRIHMLMLGIPAIFHVFHTWWKYPTLVSEWVDKYAPSAKFIITGHTHHAGIWKRKNRVIINTGCFGFPSHPRAVVLEEEKTISVYKLTLTNGYYSLGRACADWSVL